MNRYLHAILVIVVVSVSFSPAIAAPKNFHEGLAIPAYGPVASVDSDMVIPVGTVLKTSFDVDGQAKPGEVVREFVSVARFINMHVENGMPIENIKLAVIVHGRAANDLLANEAYAARMGSDNANAPLIAALLDNGVEVILCGQSAAAQDIAKQDLLPGVKMALSAMTAHALLQQQGYALNPF